MHPNKTASFHVNSVDNNYYNNNSINIERNSCFNPTIYFACKLCRQSTRNVDELLLHKRLKHTAEELRGIKCIIFEEKFVKTEFDDPDQLLPLSSESEDFMREDTLFTERQNKIDQDHIVNNINSNETVSRNNYQSKEFNLPNPYVLLKRLTFTEINSFSNSIVISEGKHLSTKNTRSRKQNSIASHLADEQIPRPIPSGETEHCIGTKRNGRSVFPTELENRLEISNSKRCKIVETGDELIRKEIESENVVNNSVINDEQTQEHLSEDDDIPTFQRDSPNTILFRLLSGESVDSSNTCSDVFNIAKAGAGTGPGGDLIKDTQELEDGQFIVAHIIKDCDGTEKVEFLSTDTPTIEAASSVSAVSTTEYGDAVNPVPNVINEFHGINMHEDRRDIEIERPSRYIAELSTSNLMEQENRNYVDLSYPADFHEDCIQDDESDLLAPIDEHYSTETPISEPILPGTGTGTGTDQISSQTEIFNLQMYTQNTIHKLFTETEADLDLNKSAEADPIVTTKKLISVFVPDPVLTTQGTNASNFNENPSPNICTPTSDVDCSTLVNHTKSKPPQENLQNDVPPTIQSTSRYNTRTRINPSKISYSENHSCLTCNTDFYTIEDLETHERKCSLLNGDARKSSRYGNMNKTGLKLQDDRRADDEDIQIITFKSKPVKPVQDLVSDDDYIPDNYNSDQASNGNGSESENDDKQKQNDCAFDSTETAEYDQKPPLNPNQQNQNEIPNNQTPRPIPPISSSSTEDELELSISFTEWLKRQAKNHPKRIFRLEPDPLSQDQTQATSDANSACFIITGENPIKCKLCSLNLYSEFDARYHLKRCWQFNKKSHKYCLKCDKSFRQQYQLRAHRTRHHPKPGTLPFVCDVCNKKLKCQYSLKHHKLYRCSKTSIPKDFVCEVCGKAFVDPSGLREHKRVHSDDRPFKCSICPRAYKTKKSRRDHEGTHSRKHECPLCLRTLATKTGLSNHVKTHTQLGELSFPCSVPSCSLKFPKKNALEAHCINDHGVPKFACTETDCPKTFFSSMCLYNHKMKTHSSPDKFKCTENGCSRTFKHKTMMIEHVRTHTGETPYQCDTCGNTYTKQWSFQKHLRVHTDSHNKFSCNKCPRKFPGSWELKQHLLIHEKGKQFKCDTCGFKCMTKANLKGHLKVHEGLPRKRGRKNKKPEFEESETETDTDSDTESESENEEPEKTGTGTESHSDSGVKEVFGNEIQNSSEKISNKGGSA